VNCEKNLAGVDAFVSQTNPYLI